MHSDPKKLFTENQAFRKRSSHRRNLKTPALCFSVNGKHFENETQLSKTMTSRQSCDFPARVSLKHKSKMAVGNYKNKQGAKWV